MTSITCTINGKPVTCAPGTSILEAAQQSGFRIPTLCHHPSLEPTGACRLCLVEDEKTGRLLASCVTPVSPDLTISTDSPRLKNHRKNIIRLLIAEHPESCLVCSKGNQCQLRKIAAELGVSQTGLYPMYHYKPLEQANPFIIRDLNKCILCGKCIRADHELVVVGAIDYNLRGFTSRPATAHGQPLEFSQCTFCGTCVCLCPTGALATKNTHYVGTSHHELTTVCGFCGVGCSLTLGAADGRIVGAKPALWEGTVNGPTLCVRGHYAHDFLNTENRLTSPLIRKNGELVSTSWDEAMDVVAEKLLSITKTAGPQSVGFYGSSKCTNEENYLFQKIARVVFRTNNLDNGGYFSGRPLLKLMEERTGGGCRVNPLRGIEEAEAIFVVGGDPTHSSPVLSYYVKRATRKGIPLIIADPRKTELMRFASTWLSVSPHTDLELINGLSALLSESENYDQNFIDKFTEGFDTYRDSLSSIDLKTVSARTGVERPALEQAAQILKGKRIAFLVGHGILQQRYANHCLESLLNFALMTGSLRRKGAGFYFITRENNQVGAWDMGTVPDSLPGRIPLDDGKNRREWELAWNCKLSPDHGLDIVRMIEEVERGKLKALYVMGENPLRSLPEPNRVRNALNSLEFLVVQDILDTETTRLAHVVFPAAAFSEKGGSFTNMEGRVQTFQPVVSPPGVAKTDLQILDLLSAKMGYSKIGGSLEKVRAEIAHLTPMYAFLGSPGREFWIGETTQKRLSNPKEKGALIPFAPLTSLGQETSPEQYPFTAIIGSWRYHLGSGTRTSHSSRMGEFAWQGEAEISSVDATRLNLHEGNAVRVISPHGSLLRKVTINKGLRRGLVFIPLAASDNEARQLVGLSRLGDPDSPGFKECPIRLEAL